MKFINIDRAVLKSQSFLVASRVQQGVWIALLGYCCDQENGGRIENCKAWDDLVWLQSVGVRTKEVTQTSPLWSWDGESLKVHFYPAKQQQALISKRLGGKKGADAKWGANGIPNGIPISDATSSPNGSNEGTPNGSPICVKGKEREREREEEGEGQATHTHKVTLNHPRDLAEAIAVGEMIGVPGPVVEAWYADAEACGWRNGRGELWQNWRRELTYHRDRVRQGQSNPPGKMKMPPGLLLKMLREQAAVHPGNPESLGVRSKLLADREAYRALERQIRELATQVTEA